jgi:hypothetical protein
MRCRLALIISDALTPKDCTLKRCLDAALASLCEFALKQW